MQAEALLAHPPPYPLDLGVTHAVRDSAKQIAEVLQVYKQALSLTPNDESDSFYCGTVIGRVVQPLLQSCKE